MLASRTLGIGLILALAGSACLAGDIRSTAVFERNGQGLYGTSTTAGFDRTFSFARGWGAQEFSEAVSVLGQAGYASGRMEAGRAGIETRFHGSLGSADIKTSYDLSVHHADIVARGQRIEFTSSAARLATPGSNRLAVRGPSLELQIDAVANVKGTLGAGARTSLTGAIHADGSTNDFRGADARQVGFDHSRDVTLVDTGGEKRYNLVNLGNAQLQKSFEVGPGRIDLAAPQGMDATSSFYRNGVLRAEATSSNSVVSGTLSIPQAIGQVFAPLKALKGEVNLLGSRHNPNDGTPQNPDGTYGGGYAKMDYTLFDATVTLGAAMHQAVEFTPVDRLPMVIYSDAGHYYSGFVGDQVSFPDPNFSTPTDVHFIMEVGFGGKMTNTLGAQMNFGLGLEVLKASASVLGYELANVGPLFTDSATMPVNSPFALYSTPAFDVEGFNWHTEYMTIHVLPTPGSMVLLGLGTALCARRRRG